MVKLIEKLFPICRSLTGEGNRKTLQILKDELPNLELKTIKSGTDVFDWQVPKEWKINDAYVKDSSGKKIIDFKDSNLHVMSYSTPVNKKINLSELKNHLITKKETPNYIPYATSYYKENWAFCISYNQYKDLKEDEYEVVIDSKLFEGVMDYGELYVEGKSKKEILFSTYICHPSLANDNLSGIYVLTELAKYVSSQVDLQYSYRFLFVPETIGVISWLSKNKNHLNSIEGGLVATCLGDDGNVHYKRSRKGDSMIDKIVEKVLMDSNCDYEISDFYPIGSDERQYCSLGIILNMGSLMKTPYLDYEEYHTSGDNLEFISKKHLKISLNLYKKVVYYIEHNFCYLNTKPYCEPQLGKRGLYRTIGAKKEKSSEDMRKAFLWILNYSDGNHSLLDISKKSNIDFMIIKKASMLLIEKELLELKYL